MFISFLHSEVAQNTLHNFSTLIYHLGTFISLAMENPCRLIIISRVLKYDKIEGAFKGKILVFFFYSIEHRLSQDVFINIKQYRKNVWQKYLGTD